MATLVGLLVFSTLAVTALGLECPADECSSVNCTREVSEDRRPPCKENERLVDHRTFCGCCPMCVTLIGEGEVCSLGIPLTIPPGPFDCQEGLVCVGTIAFGICTRIAEHIDTTDTK